jgi:hypothetical protein
MQNGPLKQTISIKSKLVILVVGMLLLTSGSTLFFVYLTYHNDMSYFLKLSLKTAVEKFNYIEQSDVKMLSSTLQALLENNDIKKLYLAKDR